MWEGGTRGAAFIHGSMLSRPGSVSRALIHVSDWLPTLISAAGGDLSTIMEDGDNIDGVDQWAVLRDGLGVSNRRMMLYNIDPLRDPTQGGNAAIRWNDSSFRTLNCSLFRLENYKLIVGPPGYVPLPPKINDQDPSLELDVVKDNQNKSIERSSLLFDLTEDEEERNDLSNVYPGIVEDLKIKLE